VAPGPVTERIMRGRAGGVGASVRCRRHGQSLDAGGGGAEGGGIGSNFLAK
jgi:hypothetical protein